MIKVIEKEEGKNEEKSMGNDPSDGAQFVAERYRGGMCVTHANARTHPTTSTYRN